MIQTNPFVVHGYAGPEYFCDRVSETEYLLRTLTQTGNVLLTAQRRVGKTGLIEHCFQRSEIKGHYHTFLIDIYATKNLREMVFLFGKAVFKKWGLELGDIKSPLVTLEEIFAYLEAADMPCIVAFDEFQTIALYPETNVEALLRTHIQHCKNCRFIFSGSQRHMLAEMFNTAARPFYQSTTTISLEPIALDHYIAFAQKHFETAGKHIEAQTIKEIYKRFEGVTWYVQYLLNTLYNMTALGENCTSDRIEEAMQIIMGQLDFNMASLVFQLPSKQKELLYAICKEGKAQSITAKKFLNKYRLTASMVQAAIKGLLEKDYVSSELGVYFVYDKFLAEWVLRH